MMAKGFMLVLGLLLIIVMLACVVLIFTETTKSIYSLVDEVKKRRAERKWLKEARSKESVAPHRVYGKSQSS